MKSSGIQGDDRLPLSDGYDDGISAFQKNGSGSNHPPAPPSDKKKKKYSGQLTMETVGSMALLIFLTKFLVHIHQAVKEVRQQKTEKSCNNAIALIPFLSFLLPTGHKSIGLTKRLLTLSVHSFIERW